MTTSITQTTHTVLASPVGPLTLVATDGILSGLYMDQQRHAPDPRRFGERTPDCLPEVRLQLRAYFDGDLTRFSVPIAPGGTAFQRQVWSALNDIPYGQTTTYGDLAASIGYTTAARAVGMANGHNPIGIIIPCHRVLGASGALTGYGGGLERKQALLSLERSTHAPDERPLRASPGAQGGDGAVEQRCPGRLAGQVQHGSTAGAG